MTCFPFLDGSPALPLNFGYKYVKWFIEKLKAYSGTFLREKQYGFGKDRSCFDAAFKFKLLFSVQFKLS